MYNQPAFLFFLIMTFLVRDQQLGNKASVLFSVCVLSRVWLFATPWTVAHQAPLSLGLFTQEYWNGLPFPPPGDLPSPGVKPSFLCLWHWRVDSLPLHHLGSLSIWVRIETQILFHSVLAGGGLIFHLPWGNSKSPRSDLRAPCQWFPLARPSSLATCWKKLPENCIF